MHETAHQVSEANVKVQCPSSECKKSIHRDEIFALLDANMRTKFNQFLINVNCFPHQKTCPSCNHITTIDLKELADPVVKKMGFCILCSECDLKWCFPCQSPWHEPLTCRDFQLGDKLFRSWAKEHHHGQVNAQKCPKCKVISLFLLVFISSVARFVGIISVYLVTQVSQTNHLATVIHLTQP